MSKSTQSYKNSFERVGAELVELGARVDRLPGEVCLLELRVKIGLTEVDEHMCIVKAASDEGPVVAFVTAPDLDVLVHLVAAKLLNGSMKWREDRPYGNGK